MSARDHRTARILATRMVESFFDGLSEAERRELIVGPGGGGSSPLYSMLSYTFDVFLESVSYSEDEGRELFQEAVRKKLEQLRREAVAKAGRRQEEEA